MSILYVIYAHPSNYPDHFVVRPFYISPNEVRPASKATLHDSLAAARATLPENRKNLGRQDDDAPALVETWI